MQLNYEAPGVSASLSRRTPRPLSHQSYLLAMAGGGVQGSSQALAQQLMLLGLAQYL